MRKTTKRLRFEVLKRDKFTCQYCGRSAPEVVLNVDHVQPVAHGGFCNKTNLVAACFDCNSGKSCQPIHGGVAEEVVFSECRKLGVYGANFWKRGNPIVLAHEIFDLTTQYPYGNQTPYGFEDWAAEIHNSIDVLSFEKRISEMTGCS